MPSVPLDPLVPHLLDLMAEAIDAADWKRAPLTMRQEAQRTAVTTAALMLPATCREARALAKNDELRWAWMLAYELARTNTGPKLRLYDGLPSGCGSLKQVPAVRPLHDPAAAPPPTGDQIEFIDQCRETTVAIHKARRCFAMHAEHDTRGFDTNVAGAKAVQEAKLADLTEATDLPDSVPRKVRAFADYCRWLWQSASTDPHVLRERPCGRRGCPRWGHVIDGEEGGELWFRLSFTQGAHRRLNVHAPEASEVMEGEREYWRHVSATRYQGGVHAALPRPLVAESLLDDDTYYCCTACALRCADEYDAIVRCAAVDELAPPSTTRDGRNSAARQFRAVVKRNQVIGRRMRATRNAQPRHLPVDFDLEGERQRVRDMLCIDTGLVYAGALIGELPRAARPPHALPSTDCWRSLGSRWCGAHSRIWAVYAPCNTPARLGQHREEGLVESHLSTPRWLRRVKDQCLSVF